MKKVTEFEQIPVLNTLFLAIIAKNPGITGYDIIKEIPKVVHTEYKIKTGTLYTQLRRMEGLELVKSTQEQGGRKLRKYTITEIGKNYLFSMKEIILNRINNVLFPLIDFIGEIKGEITSSKDNSD